MTSSPTVAARQAVVKHTAATSGAWAYTPVTEDSFEAPARRPPISGPGEDEEYGDCRELIRRAKKSTAGGTGYLRVRAASLSDADEPSLCDRSSALWTTAVEILSIAASKGLL